MKQYSASFDDGAFTFRVSPITLDDYETVSDLLEQAHLKFRGGKALRAFVAKFVDVAEPERDGARLQAEDFGQLDPGLILALGREWDKGVRDVPLPLALPSSDIGPFPAESPSPEPSTEPSSATAS